MTPKNWERLFKWNLLTKETIDIGMPKAIKLFKRFKILKIKERPNLWQVLISRKF